MILDKSTVRSRRIHWRYLAPFIAQVLSGCATAGPIDIEGPSSGSQPYTLNWCGTLKLPAETPTGVPLGGLSDLAYDQATNTLYLVSDRGRLYRAHPAFRQDQLTALNIDRSWPLRDQQGRRLRMPYADSEAMALVERHGKKRLLIGFEEDHRLQYFDLQGHAQGAALHPDALHGAQYNGSLEAVTDHPRRGIVAGLETPPEGMPNKTTRLFDLKGHRWTYRLSDATESSLTSMAPLGDDLLTLERAFKPLYPLVISLRHARLNDDGTTTVTDIARLSSADGWLLDNFEGLTPLGKRRYLMVSDDNFKRIQSSLLACFEIPSFAN